MLVEAAAEEASRLDEQPVEAPGMAYVRVEHGEGAKAGAHPDSPPVRHTVREIRQQLASCSTTRAIRTRAIRSPTGRRTGSARATRSPGRARTRRRCRAGTPSCPRR